MKSVEVVEILWVLSFVFERERRGEERNSVCMCGISGKHELLFLFPSSHYGVFQ